MSELVSLGLSPEIQKAHVTSDVSSKFSEVSGTIENIITRIPGTDNSKAIMLAAHYDSTPNGPGAADDGVGIAAMLETIRAIQASGPLKNDLILLMTDGEEEGLLGAKAFMTEHPWAKDVGLVFNFEARGNKGPSFMFETSDQNGWIIKEFMKAAPYPIAYSLIYNVYKLMPNDTDLTIFREKKLVGLNFAFAMGYNSYHKPMDTPENLDPSSLQHQGEYMLSLTRHFGNLELDEVKQEDRVYFNVFGWKMVSYPLSWVNWFTLFGVLLFVATLCHGIYRRRMSLKGLAGGFLITLLCSGVLFGVVTLLWSILKSNVSKTQLVLILKDPQVSIYYLIGLLVLSFIMIFLLIRWLSCYIRAENVWIGALLLWLLLCVGTTIYLPGGSYLFTWPFIFSLFGLNMSLIMREGAWTWISVLFAAPGFILFTPIWYLVSVMMTLELAGILAVLVSIAFSLVFPVFCTLQKRDIRATHDAMVQP
nr:M20/M25/M40 family metallo-hydrolase [Paenibacillus mangrovi]